MIRIVKLTLKPEKVEEFCLIFRASHNLILNFDGCLKLELLADINSTNVYFTISHWDSEIFLNNYRESYLFQSTWAKVKPLFAQKAEAWSLESTQSL